MASVQFAQGILLCTHLDPLFFQIMKFYILAVNGVADLLFLCLIVLPAAFHLYLVALARHLEHL